jgi:hypothetical protein
MFHIQGVVNRRQDPPEKYLNTDSAMANLSEELHDDSLDTKIVESAVNDSSIDQTDHKVQSKMNRKDSQNLSRIKLGDSDNQLFMRFQPNGELRVVWYIKDIHKFWTETSKVKKIRSPKFATSDDSHWRLYLLPNGERSAPGNISLYLKAVDNPSLDERFHMNRSCEFRFWHYRDEKLVGLFKSFSNFTKKDSEWGFNKFINKEEMIAEGLNKHLFIEALIDSHVNIDGVSQKLKLTSGLRNEGTTWYINSLLQTFFIIAPLRKAVFKMPGNEISSIPLCLQRIFYNLQFADKSVRTTELLHSFGWQAEEANTQHDVMEFNWILSDKLEKKMECIPELKGTYKRTFEGTYINYCECINIEYK